MPCTEWALDAGGLPAHSFLMNKNTYAKPLDQIALLLTLRPGRTERAREVSALVLARIELAMKEGHK